MLMVTVSAKGNASKSYVARGDVLVQVATLRSYKRRQVYNEINRGRFLVYTPNIICSKRVHLKAVSIAVSLY